MMSRVPSIIKRLVSEMREEERGSIQITNSKIIDKFVSNPHNTFLVSFPRTGSHWLRMLMELYFKRPSLVRVFYYPDKKNYLTLHTHDLDLDVYRKHVIYLYRNPVPTVYSQMRYHKEELSDEARVRHWAQLYARHLQKWLIEETESEKKTVIRYENMVRDIHAEFSKVTGHFGERLDHSRFDAAVERVSKKEVKKKTTHDDKVISTETSYAEQRRTFEEDFGIKIMNILKDINPLLEDFFKD